MVSAWAANAHLVLG
jgi:hypothetical protein